MTPAAPTCCVCGAVLLIHHEEMDGRCVDCQHLAFLEVGEDG